MISTIYSSQLIDNYAQYARYPGAPSFFFYDTIQVKISTSEVVIFISNSSMDMNGYFYNGTFDPLNTQANLLAEDDDNGGNLQFYIQMSLDANQTYILIATTFNTNVTAPFTLTAYSLVGTVEFNGTGIILPSSTTSTTITLEGTPTAAESTEMIALAMRTTSTSTETTMTSTSTSKWIIELCKS